ncbi:hypothetical protein O181_124441 [Austropuccinia psidii MF-1]|uniref:Uncharacterized protein n=1 Tax=Austropuccinia psidii MF-1 TaxID=1389203 RepID=A0A9Q3KR78_9BASI|nr:hypothetical protein [Austropuccinia psidii MF-1]
MSPVYLRDLGFQRNQPEDREGLSRARRPGRGHLGHSGGWQNNEGDNIYPAIHTPIQQEPQTRGLEGYGSKVQPGISLGRTWSKLPEDLSQRDRLQSPYGNHQRLEFYQAVQTPGGKGIEDKGESSHYPSYRRTVNPDRAYLDSFRLTRSRLNQLSSGFTPFRHQQINDQESPLYTISRGFQENKRIQVEKQHLFQQKQERMCQYSEQTQKQFAELEESHERMKKLTASMDKIVKTLQEGHAQLSKAFEETNKRLNLVFEEQHHSKRDRDCLNQDINKLFNVYHDLKHNQKAKLWIIHINQITSKQISC